MGALDDKVGEWIIGVRVCVSFGIVDGFHEVAQDGAVVVAGRVDGWEFVAMVGLGDFGLGVAFVFESVPICPFVDIPGGTTWAGVEYDYCSHL